MKDLVFLIFCAFLFGWIGSLFGAKSMVFGIALGIAVGLSSNKTQKEKEKEREPAINNITEKATTINSIQNEVNKVEPSNIGRKMTDTKKIAIQSNPIYVAVVVDLIAACITADGEIEESELDIAISLIKDDELIIDKNAAIESLNIKIDEFNNERNKSKAVFNLKMTAVIHKANQLKDDCQKERIIIILDNMLDAINTGNRTESVEIVRKIKANFSSSSQTLSLKDTAESYILKSGDPEAIGALRQMQNSPEKYSERFTRAAKENPIMKTALGVFTGMIAANLVSSAFQQYQLKEALANFDTELESMGGLDNLQLDQGGNIQTANLDYSESIESSENLEFEDTEELEVASNEDSFDDIETDDIEVDSDTDLDFEDFDFFS